LPNISEIFSQTTLLSLLSQILKVDS
jgi:hypothetical protein